MRKRTICESAISVLLVLLFVFSASISAFSLENTDVETGSENDIAITGAEEEASETGTLATPEFSSIEGSGRNVVFNWKEIPGAAKYMLFYYSDADKCYKRIALTADTTYMWSGATVGVTYRYTIRCVDSSGKYASSYLKDGKTFKLMLATPEITKIEDAKKGVNIIWSAVDGAAKYRVFYKNTNGWKCIGDTESTSFNFTSPNYNERMTYTVRCLSETGNIYESYFDSTGYGYKFGIKYPIISTVKLNTTKNTLDIYWNEIIDAVYYRVYIKNSTGSDWTSIGEVVANSEQQTTSYSWAGFAAGQSYTFTVRCINIYGNFISDFDRTGCTYTVNVSTPKITSVEKATNSSVTIKWGAISGAEKYRVFYKNGSGWKAIADTTSNSYTWTGPVVGKSYKYTVRCVSSKGQYASSFDSAGYNYTLYLDTPVISSVESSGSTAVKITWGAVTGAAKYRLFYKNGSSWVTIATTTDTSYTWTKPGFGVSYTYTVRCISADGKLWTSDYSRTGASHTLYLETPKITSCSVLASNKFTIKWNKISGASKYRVFYYVNSKKSYVKIGDTANTSFNVTSAKLNSTYRLTVRCISSDASKWESYYDKEGYTYSFVLSTPKVSKAESQGGTSVKVSWGAVTGAERYAVFIKDSPWKRIGYTTTNSFTWDSAVVNTTYTFTVRCCDSSGTYVSDFDRTGYTYKHQLATPKISSIVSLDESTIRITWGAVSGAYAYRVFYKSGNTWKGIATTTATKYIWDECTNDQSYTYTVRCVDKNGYYTSSFDSSGYTYTITNLSSAIADVALAEVEYWNDGMHGYSCQGLKYTKDLGVNLYDWCGYFATYCCKHAGVSMFQNNKTIYGFVGAWETWGKNNGQWHAKGSGYVPCPGDMAIWGTGNDHVTVVVKVDENAGVFYDVGGNEVSYDYTTSVVNYDGPFDYNNNSYLKGFAGTHILG